VFHDKRITHMSPLAVLFTQYLLFSVHKSTYTFFTAHDPILISHTYNYFYIFCSALSIRVLYFYGLFRDPQNTADIILFTVFYIFHIGKDQETKAMALLVLVLFLQTQSWSWTCCNSARLEILKNIYISLFML